MARGGRRPGSGRKALPQAEIDGRTVAGREFARRLIETLNKPAEPDEAAANPDAASWRPIWEAQDLNLRERVRRYWYDKRDGKATQLIAGEGPGGAVPVFIFGDDGTLRRRK